MESEVNRHVVHITDDRRPGTAPHIRTAPGLISQQPTRPGSSYPGSGVPGPGSAGSGHSANGHPANGHPGNGHPINGHARNGFPANGRSGAGVPGALPGAGVPAAGSASGRPAPHRATPPGPGAVPPPAPAPGSAAAPAPMTRPPGSTPSIADRFADLLAPLSNKRRRGLIARLSVGYYEGWHPSRAEVTQLVNEELRRSPR